MEDIRRLKFVLIGDKEVGKRSILVNGFNKPERLSSFYLPIESYEVNFRHNDRNYRITCYDSLVSSSSVSKSEASIVEQFTATAVNGADAILFCYTPNQNNLRSLANWYKEISVYLTPNTTLYLVNTKNALGGSTINPEDLRIPIVDHYKISCRKTEDVHSMFSQIISRIEDPNLWSKSQTLQKTSTLLESHMKDSYSSPEKKSPTKREVRYSDKKEKIVLMEGSYVKRLTVVDESKPGMERSTRLVQKTIRDDPNMNEEI